MRAWLLDQGLVEGRDFVVRRYDGATHNEASWRARLEDPLTFLFGKPGTDVNPRYARLGGGRDLVPDLRRAIPQRRPVQRPHRTRRGRVHDAADAGGWQPTPWTQDWYRQEPWAKATGRDFYGTVQFRRYGGDLQGVLDRLDYLQELGVTALYLNPVNDAPSLHKYDARNYRHIDRNFGPDPLGDEARMTAETPPDPTTWGWTAADSLFLTLVREVHRRGMRIILDYSWNHTGINFWAWQDVLAHQRRHRTPTGTRSSASTTPRPRTPTSSPTAAGSACRRCRSGRRSAGPRDRPTAPSKAISSRACGTWCST